jgi:hypothetical protein
MQSTGKFTLVDYAEIAKLEEAGENIADHVDAIFSGRVTRFGSHDRTESFEGYGGKTYLVYYRDVTLEFSYMLKRSGDGAIIGQSIRGGPEPNPRPGRADCLRPTILPGPSRPDSWSTSHARWFPGRLKKNVSLKRTK